MQVNGLSGAGSKTAGIKMAQKMDSFSINIKNEIARKQKEQQEISSNKSLSAEEKNKKNDINISLASSSPINSNLLFRSSVA